MVSLILSILYLLSICLSPLGILLTKNIGSMVMLRIISDMLFRIGSLSLSQVSQGSSVESLGEYEWRN